MPRQTIVAALIAFVAGATLLPVAASGDSATIADVAGDGVEGQPDLIEVSVGHTKTGKLRHTLVTADPVPVAQAPCLTMRAVYPGEGVFRVCGSGEIRRVSDNTLVGEARVARPNPQIITYTFSKREIEHSSAYRWRAEVRTDSCRGPCDVAPATFQLHAERYSYEQWAIKFLDEINAPQCRNNRIVVIAWEANEGTAAVFNPLATTYPMNGSTIYNGFGVRNYRSLRQGLTATRLTLERGWDSYGYGRIVNRLRECARPMRTARAIRASQWCAGCSHGRYVVWLIDPVRDNYEIYAARQIATY